MVRFSIIVPIYNTQAFLKQCIDSILAQQITDYELILVDDGSPDDCPQICDAYAQKDAKIKVVHKANGGLISARKAGVQASCGEYILYVDSDDWVCDNWLAELDAVLDRHDVDMVVFGFTKKFPTHDVVCDDGIPQGLYHEQQIEGFYNNLLVNKNKPFHTYGIRPAVWAKCFKKSFFAEFQLGVDEAIRNGEDLAVTFPALLHAKSIYFLNKPLYNYRINESSMTNTFNKNGIADCFALLDYMEGAVDISRYGLDCQLASYFLFRVTKELLSAAHHTPYGAYKRMVRQVAGSKWFGAAKEVDVTRASKKDKLSYRCVQNQWWTVLYLICAIHKLRRKK